MSFIKKTLILIILGFLIHIGFIYYFPYLKVWMIFQNAEALSSVNVPFYRDVPTANSREVVRPSPDLMYSGCGYDVTYDPLVIKTDIPNTYWSISFFSGYLQNDCSKIKCITKIAQSPEMICITIYLIHSVNSISFLIN